MLRVRKEKVKNKRGVPLIEITIREDVLSSIFDECDRYDRDETGGRILGEFSNAENGNLKIEVTGVIEPGPGASRSSTSFFQDGHYQAEIFRKIERVNPQIEHLGNWHTHHVNGYPTLSGGDIATYQRIVNHEKHNLSFFYALLVTSRNPRQTGLNRYNVRHYVLFSDNSNVYEVDKSNLSITLEPAVWPPKEGRAFPNPMQEKLVHKKSDKIAIRAQDKETIEMLFPLFQPFHSAKADTFFWKGAIKLHNDTTVTIMVPEVDSEQNNGGAMYQPIVKQVPGLPAAFSAGLSELEFRTASEAILDVERKLNAALFAAKDE